MRLRTLTAIGLVLGLGACATNQEPPLYGNYENIDDQSLCLGMMAFAADYPKAVWPGKSKAYQAKRKDFYSVRSSALYKIAVKKYGKQDAAERGITGYSSGKSLAYVLGGGAVQEALGRCEAVAEEALAVDQEYQAFLDHLGSKPANPVNPDIIPDAPVMLEETEIEAESTPVIVVGPEATPAAFTPSVETVVEKDGRRYLPAEVPPGMKVMSTPQGDFLVSDKQPEVETIELNKEVLGGKRYSPSPRRPLNPMTGAVHDALEDTSGDDLNAKWRRENLEK